MANGFDPTRLARAMSIEHYHPRRRFNVYRFIRLVTILILLLVASAAGYWIAILASRGGGL